MDLRKIGKYIAKKRQEKGFTQEGLAEELDISNRAISKWERGICLPESDNLAKLCQLFDVSYNELLSGEDLDGSDYKKQAENNLKEFSAIETAMTKKFLFYEDVIAALSVIILLILTVTASFAEMPDWQRVVMIVCGFLLALTGLLIAMKIEAEAGKYECRHCKHRYVPKYSAALMAMHFGRTRYMTCPKCGKKSWQKKVV